MISQLIASRVFFRRPKGRALCLATPAVCMLAIGLTFTPARAINCDQTSSLPRPIQLGVSGGNINAFFITNHQQFCTSGTLGSMVQDQSGNQYILSNNHVLADINQAKPGELIVQPGLVEMPVNCMQSPSDTVATFTRTIKLNFRGGKKTIDAAIASVTPGDVNADILNIGGIASSVVTPKLRLAVQKMGRTTCLTQGKITAVGVKANISYSGIGGGIAKFVNQIVIAGINQTFASPGDSGSLIVTQDSCPRAVGLLFAGAADGSTIANPISAVLKGLTVTMVGSCSMAPAASETEQPELETGKAGVSMAAVESASAVRDRHEDELMSIPGAVGTGIGIGDQSDQLEIIVYIKKLTLHAKAAVLKEVEGMPVKLIQNGGFVAY
jgi:hypothetical protein